MTEEHYGEPPLKAAKMSWAGCVAAGRRVRKDNELLRFFVDGERGWLSGALGAMYEQIGLSPEEVESAFRTLLGTEEDHSGGV